MATVAPSLVWLGPQMKTRPVVLERRAGLIAMLGVLCVGCAIRFVGLGAAPLHNNELNHYFVARSLQGGGAPLLPSGEWYARGIEYSRAVAASLGVVSPIEFAVRLPAAIFGCLALVLFAVVAWRMTRPAAALLATLLFAIFPAFVELSRFGRFYTLQLALGVLAMYAGWQALRDVPEAERDRFSRVRQSLWMVLAAAALAAAAHIQVVTLSVALGLAAAMVVRASLDVRAWRRAAFGRSVALQCLVLGAIGAAAGLVLMPDLAVTLRERAVNVPFWARSGGENVSSYFTLLTGSMPILAVGGAAACYWAVRRYGMLGVYLTLWFAVPFVVHSALPWKAGRFIVLAVPALMLVVSIGFTDLLAAGESRLRGRLSGSAERAPGPSTVAILAMAAVALAAVTPLPALRIASWLRAEPDHAWSDVMAVVRTTPEVQGLPMGHSLPLPALHYLGDLDFTINESLREQWLTIERKRDLGIAGPAGYAWLPEGAADFYTGRPVLTRANSIRAHFAGAGGVLIGLHNSGAILGIDVELQATLAQHATELCRGRCGSMLLYYWQFENESGAQSVENGT